MRCGHHFSLPVQPLAQARHVDDPRRINVAITRDKRALVIIGSLSTFYGSHCRTDDYMAHMKRAGEGGHWGNTSEWTKDWGSWGHQEWDSHDQITGVAATHIALRPTTPDERTS